MNQITKESQIESLIDSLDKGEKLVIEKDEPYNLVVTKDGQGRLTISYTDFHRSRRVTKLLVKALIKNRLHHVGVLSLERKGVN